MLIALLPDPTAASLEVWSLPLTRRLAGCLNLLLTLSYQVLQFYRHSQNCARCRYTIITRYVITMYMIYS